MTDKEKYTMLIKQKRDLEDTNNILSKQFTQACEHGISYGYYFPYPNICFKCSVDYYKYCKKNNLYIDETISKKVAEHLTKTEINKKNMRATIRKQRYDKNKKNALEDYKNKINLTPEEAGLRYERYIGYLLEIQGMKVDYQGANKGKQDGGIDIIAVFKQKIYIIQCKRYSNKHSIHVNTIDQFIGTLSTYKRKNPTKNIRCILYSTNDNLDSTASEALSLHPEIQHIIKPYNPNYPLVKCNIGKNKEKIYHLPTDALYDRIKIEPNKGEFYCYTTEQAEAAGFRRAKN